MTGTTVLGMLFGAALVAIGVLAAALADRIRCLKIARGIPAIPVVESAELLRTTTVAPAKPTRAVRPESKPSPAAEGGEDVITALIAAGYKKPIATEATWACTAAERATIESWTACALRRCARGGMS